MVLSPVEIDERETESTHGRTQLERDRERERWGRVFFWVEQGDPSDQFARISDHLTAAHSVFTYFRVEVRLLRKLLGRTFV